MRRNRVCDGIGGCNRHSDRDSQVARRNLTPISECARFCGQIPRSPACGGLGRDDSKEPRIPLRICRNCSDLRGVGEIPKVAVL